MQIKGGFLGTQLVILYMFWITKNWETFGIFFLIKIQQKKNSRFFWEKNCKFFDIIKLKKRQKKKDLDPIHSACGRKTIISVWAF